MGIDDNTRPYSFSESLDEVWAMSLTKVNPSPDPTWPNKGGFPSSGLPHASDSIRERLKRRSGYWLLSKGMRWTHNTWVFRLPFCEALYGQYWHWNGLWPAGDRERVILWGYKYSIKVLFNCQGAVICTGWYWDYWGLFVPFINQFISC